MPDGTSQWGIGFDIVPDACRSLLLGQTARVGHSEYGLVGLGTAVAQSGANKRTTWPLGSLVRHSGRPVGVVARLPSLSVREFDEPIG